jgi:hypothetical protein
MFPPDFNWSNSESIASFLFNPAMIEATETLNDKYFATSQEFFHCIVTFARKNNQQFIHVDWQGLAKSMTG